MHAGRLARARVAQLAALSGLPLVQGELFDRNPGPWTLDDEDHVLTFSEIWDRLVARNPKFGRETEIVRLTPGDLKQLCERCFEGGREYEAKTPRHAASSNPFVEGFF